MKNNKELLLRAVDAMARLGCLSAFVFDYEKNKIIYESRHQAFLEEVSDNDIQRYSINPYWSLVSDDTLQKLKTLQHNYPACGDVLSLSEQEYREHITTIDYPIVVKKQELYITQKSTPLILGRNGEIKVALTIINYSNKNTIESYIVTKSNRRFLFNFEKNNT